MWNDGTPLGTHAAAECRIDSLAQSWAVLCSRADPDRSRKAMRAVYDQLVRPADCLSYLNGLLNGGRECADTLQPGRGVDGSQGIALKYCDG